MALLAATVAYLAFRVASREHWDGFEQAVGIGFREIEPREANARFGAFPYPVYAYNAAATMASVLFSEPTRGVFGITWMIGQRQARPWEYLHLLSSLALTTLIAWWCVDRLRATVRAGWAWSPESRAALALAGVLLACGALSFNYSRDRLGGMAAPFYAASAYFAVRAAADRALAASRARLVATGLLLCALGVAWQMRAIGTIEYSRFVAARNQFEWLTQPASRRKDFADRPVYLDIMNAMVAQGVVPDAPRPTRYPHWATRLISLPWDTNICSSVADGTCWPR